MCGICGIATADPRRPVSADLLGRMRATVAHRGPDGLGEHTSGGVALGHTRLSIIDVAHGAQPLANEDETVWVTFNGEIYNYTAITDELRRLGHRFRTRSDTEVLVHAYEEWGLDFPRRLNGMFAFALHDERRGRVLLARDHLGVKPLFYAVEDGTLVFGSEIKAVLAGTGRSARVRPESLAEYLIFRYVAGSRSFFDDVRRLPPGHLALWEGGRLTVRPFWSLPQALPDLSPDLGEAADQLDRHLARAVEMQMMSEVPVGTFCSGGVDSGLVTGYAAAASPHRLSTFSVGFEDPAWDESALARDTASRFGTDHHSVIADPEEFRALLEQLIWYHDEPLSHPNAVPLYLLSRVARRTVTVVLTGEGADELFGGYPRYHIARLRAVADRFPAATRQAVARGLRMLPGHRASKAAALLLPDADDAVLLNSAYVDPALVERLTGIPASDALAERRALLERARIPDDPVATLSRYEMTTYLQCALDRMDRMAMASGLESRVPFLDVPLVEWGVRLESSLKVAGRANKRVVKRLAQRYLSPRITDGGKSGFGIPLGDWFRRAGFERVVSRLLNPDHPAASHFDRDVLRGLVSAHLQGDADHGEALWLLANVYLWYEVQLGDVPAARARAAGERDATRSTGSRSRAAPSTRPT